MEAKSFIVKESNISKNALIILNPSGLANSEEFKEGLFTIQQEASMKAIEVLDPKENSNILDICAAPGTKTSYIGEYVNNKSKILANDLLADKLSLIKENIDRLSLKNIELTSFDASIYQEKLKEKFDYILVDAPCSGLGVIGRKPEIRYNRTIEDIKNLSLLQRQILENSILYLKRGGYILYSTCTIGNIENIENFNYLKNKENLEVVPIDGKKYLEFTNFIDHTDGFFISKFKKI